MDRLNRFVAQVYGYAVCLITVVVMLVSTKGIIDAAFDLSDPVRAQGGAYGRNSGRPLTSFEVYKLDAHREARPPRSAPDSRDQTGLSDADLRRQYEAERETQIGNAKFRATRALFSGLFFIIVGGVLFFIHWRWLRGITSAPTTP